MNVQKMRYLADTIWHKYVCASHVYSQGEYSMLEIVLRIPAHTWKSADYSFGFEIVCSICFDEYDTVRFQEFILDPVSYLDNMNELGALNIDAILHHGFEMEYK